MYNLLLKASYYIISSLQFLQYNSFSLKLSKAVKNVSKVANRVEDKSTAVLDYGSL